MFVDISLDCVVSRRGLCGTLEKASATAFLMFPYARRTMLVLRLSQYGVVSDGCVFGLFVPLS